MFVAHHNFELKNHLFFFFFCSSQYISITNLIWSFKVPFIKDLFCIICSSISQQHDHSVTLSTTVTWIVKLQNIIKKFNCNYYHSAFKSITIKKHNMYRSHGYSHKEDTSPNSNILFGFKAPMSILCFYS